MGAGSLRPGDGTPASYVARNYDSDYHFMLIEIDSDELHFQAISRAGRTIDAGTLYQDRRDGARTRGRRRALRVGTRRPLADLAHASLEHANPVRHRPRLHQAAARLVEPGPGEQVGQLCIRELMKQRAQEPAPAFRDVS